MRPQAPDLVSTVPACEKNPPWDWIGSLAATVLHVLIWQAAALCSAAAAVLVSQTCRAVIPTCSCKCACAAVLVLTCVPDWQIVVA